MRVILQPMSLALPSSHGEVENAASVHPLRQRSRTDLREVEADDVHRAKAARFRLLILPHLDSAYNLARYLARNGDIADDIVQEAFLRAFNSLDSFRTGESRAWVLTIVRNCFLTWAMKRQREPTVVPIRGDTADDIFVGSALMDGADPAIEAEDGEAETPETILMRQSQTAAVRAAIESLPDPFREALVLRELEELSYREIAQITSAPIGTIMSRLARARQMFAASWRARFTEDETMHRGTSELGRT